MTSGGSLKNASGCVATTFDVRIPGLGDLSRTSEKEWFHDGGLSNGPGDMGSFNIDADMPR